MVGIIGGDGFYKECHGKGKVINDLLVNEISSSTTIDQSGEGMLVLAIHRGYFDIDFQLILGFYYTEEEFLCHWF